MTSVSDGRDCATSEPLPWRFANHYSWGQFVLVRLFLRSSWGAFHRIEAFLPAFEYQRSNISVHSRDVTRSIPHRINPSPTVTRRVELTVHRMNYTDSRALVSG